LLSTTKYDKNSLINELKNYKSEHFNFDEVTSTVTITTEKLKNNSMFKKINNTQTNIPDPHAVLKIVHLKMI